MKRLTHKARYITGYQPNGGVKPWEAYDRLGAYEDIGLEPEEIMELKERNTPKKPKLINGGSPVCPECGEGTLRYYAFCQLCGQRLDQ